LDEQPIEIATRSSWITRPLPAERAALNMVGTYEPADFDRIKAGLIPDGMDDKWFMFYEAPWLYAHDSWLGFCVFGVKFEVLAEGAEIVESWVSRDTEQWGGTNTGFEARFLTFLIDALLLNKPVPFPGAASPLAQHILVGRVDETVE
jgi:hypothetical protein